MDMFSALLGKSLSGGGGSEPVLISKSISSNGTYNASDDNADGYSSVSVSVPNSYTQSDEGKVVSNGALVAQGSDTVTENGTVDTTLISSLTVAVSGGTGTAVKLTSTDTDLSDIDLYIVDSGLYIYLYGSVKASGADTRIYEVPNAFDLSTIVSQLKGIRSISSSTSNSNITASVNTSNKTVSFPSMNATNYYFFVFSKT